MDCDLAEGALTNWSPNIWSRPQKLPICPQLCGEARPAYIGSLYKARLSNFLTRIWQEVLDIWQGILLGYPAIYLVTESTVEIAASYLSSHPLLLLEAKFKVRLWKCKISSTLWCAKKENTWLWTCLLVPTIRCYWTERLYRHFKCGAWFGLPCCSVIH